MATQWGREEQALYDSYERGEISQAELNRAVRELYRDMQDDMRGAAEEAAEHAYRDEIERW